MTIRPTLFFAAFLGMLAATAVSGSPASAAGQVAQVSASVVKPLTLKWLQDMNLGTIVLGPGTWSSAAVSISRTGAFNCANSNVGCSGPTQVAKYNVAGSNNQVVRISAPNVTLVNQNDTTKTLLLTIDSPGTVMMSSSGPKGVDFALGGSVTLNSNTAGGVYSGTLNVTVDY